MKRRNLYGLTLVVAVFAVVCAFASATEGSEHGSSESSSHGAAKPRAKAPARAPARAPAKAPAAHASVSQASVPKAAEPVPAHAAVPVTPAAPAAESAHVAAATTAPAAATTADEAVSVLKAGNARFATGKSEHSNADAVRRSETAANGQHPFVTIVSCADSRVPLELLFDRGIGDLFVIRVAGNVCDVDEIATAEYGIDHLGTPLMLVLGHTKCGAVTAVTTGAQVHGNLPQLVDNIKPAVAAAQKDHPDLHGDALVPHAIKANVWQGISDTLAHSEVIRERLKAGKVRIEGAIYDIAEGTIEWIGPHPQQEQLLASFEAKPSAAIATGHGPAKGGIDSLDDAAHDLMRAKSSASQPAAAGFHSDPDAHAAGGVQAAVSTSAMPVAAASHAIPKDFGLLERCMAQELYRQGGMSLVNGDHETAAERFRSALQLDPSMLAAKNDLAGICLLQHKYDQAVDMYKGVLATESQHRDALRGAALAYAALKQYPQSRQMLQRLLTLDRRDFQTWLDLGDVLFLMGQIDEAREHWNRAAQADAGQDIAQKARVRLQVYPSVAIGQTADARTGP